MKILRVIVDEMPKSCAECDWLHSLDYWHCLILDEGVLPEGVLHRYSDCPLALEHDNKRIANEVM